MNVLTRGDAPTAIRLTKRERDQLEAVMGICGMIHQIAAKECPHALEAKRHLVGLLSDLEQLNFGEEGKQKWTLQNSQEKSSE